MVIGSARPAIRSFVEHAFQPLQHPIEISYHLMIGESHGCKPVVPKHRRITVSIGHGIMCIAVHFDHQTFRWTEEIHDPAPDNDLPPKFETGQAATAQLLPQVPLRLWHVSAHAGGPSPQRLWRDATTPNPLL